MMESPTESRTTFWLSTALLLPALYLLSLGPAATLYWKVGPGAKSCLDVYFYAYNCSPLDTPAFSSVAQLYLNIWI